MKAIVQERYGPPDGVLKLQDIGQPIVNDDEVLVRVRATAVAGDDWHLMRGLPFVARMATGLRKPRNRVPGLDIAGHVEAVGAKVTRFRPGDEVFGWCKGGGFAEYVSVPEEALASKPATISFEEAAVVPTTAFTALQALRDKGRVRPGDEVLILGASGGVGTFAVQIAKALGAKVTGVCSTKNADLVRSIGADRVIDYSREDFSRSGRRYDVILDIYGNRSLWDTRRALAPHGTLVLVGGSPGRWVKPLGRWASALLLSFLGRQRLRPLIHKDRPDDLAFLKELIEAGKLTPVISARFPLHEVSEAIGRYEPGHARGKVVVTV